MGRIFNIAAMLSLLLLIATSALWIVSYWHPFVLVTIPTQSQNHWKDHFISVSHGRFYHARWFVSPYLTARGPTVENSIECNYPVVAFAILPTVWLIRLRLQQRRPAGTCPKCAYDMRATPDRCPECGATR
jgi:predicted amidophosphoribosyltransferase